MIIEYFLIFGSVLIISFLLSLIITYLRNKGATWNHFFESCFFIGIMIHEISHYIMSILTHTKVTKTNIIPTRNQQGGLSGSIRIANSNFLQTLLVSLAPLFIGTYLIGFILSYIFSPFVNYTIAVILIYIIISILAMISPSIVDIRMIVESFRMTHKRYTIIQIFIISLAVPISSYLIILYGIILFDSLITLFFFTLFFYYLMRYSGLGLIYIFRNIRIFKRNTKYIKYKTRLKNRGKDRKSKFSPRTQW